MVYNILYQTLKNIKIDKDEKFAILENKQIKKILPEILVLKTIDKEFGSILQKLFENKNFNEDIKINLDDFLTFLTILKQRTENA